VAVVLRLALLLLAAEEGVALEQLAAGDEAVREGRGLRFGEIFQRGAVEEGAEGRDVIWVGGGVLIRSEAEQIVFADDQLPAAFSQFSLAQSNADSDCFPPRSGAGYPLFCRSAIGSRQKLLFIKNKINFRT
jgi:hypothetical protein